MVRTQERSAKREENNLCEVIYNWRGDISLYVNQCISYVFIVLYKVNNSYRTVLLVIKVNSYRKGKIVSYNYNWCSLHILPILTS